MSPSPPPSAVSKLAEKLSSTDSGAGAPKPVAGLDDPRMLVALCHEVNRWIRIDLERAERLAAALQEPASRQADRGVAALSRRALANVLHRRGRHQEALEKYRQALSAYTRLGDEVEAAVTRSTAIHALIYLGEYDTAFRWADIARRVFEEHGDELHLARLELNRANILYRQDRWEEALVLYRQALDSLQRVGDAATAAVCLRTMAVCQVSLNRFEDALASYRRARDYCAEHGLPLLALENEYNIAYIHFLRGEYTRALALYDTVRQECERIDDREHLALCELDRAEIFLELNLVEEALQLSQAAFDRFEGLGMRYEAAKALTLLAVSTSRQGKAFLALELLERARGIFDAEENRVWPAQIDLLRALVYFGEGRSLEAARLAAAAIEVFAALPIPSRVAYCETLLARLALEAGRLDEARERCRRALEAVGDSPLPAVECHAYQVLGEVEEAGGERDAALAAYRQARSQLERLRSHLQIDELKITFLKDKLRIYESLVAVLLAGEPTDDERLEAFECIEKAKSRSLADLLAFRSHVLPPTISGRSDLVARIRGLREELNWYYRRIDVARMKTDERARDRLAALEKESVKREEDLVRALRELQTADLELSSLQEASTIDLETVRSVLPEGHLLLEYFIARGIVYVCLVGRRRFEVVPLTVESRVRELHRLIQFQLSKFLLGREYLDAHRDLVDRATRSHLASLYDDLIAPIEPSLDCRHLTIVAHDFLHRLPFHALLAGDRWLIDRVSISYAPSAGVDYLCRSKASRPGRDALVLGIGDRRTPRIADEARAVAQVLEGCTLLLDDEATVENLRRQARGRAIVHIATHGVFRRDNPMFSAIRLGDARLSLFDLYHLRLDADLVVLSGCGTGLNVVVGADELVGLARGLLYAGARSVVVSLWDVDDESTSQLMRFFYRGVLERQPPAEALRQAMIRLRESHAHPYFWAPFVLIGRP